MICTFYTFKNSIRKISNPIRVRNARNFRIGCRKFRIFRKTNNFRTRKSQVKSSRLPCNLEIYTESEKRSVSLSQPKSRIHVKAINNPCSNKTIITASRGEAFAICATPIEAHELSTIRVLGETHTHAHVRNPTVTDETSIKQILVIRVSKEFRVRVAC